MKAINVYFDDDDFKKLEKEKGELSWRDYILKLFKEHNGS